MSLMKMRYKKYLGQFVPIITIGIQYKNKWYPVEAYIDSGATYSIFSDKFANRIGLDFKSGKLIYPQVGDGGMIPAYLHELDIQLGTQRFKALIGFSEKLGIGFNLLGRISLFTRFKVCFDEQRFLVTFEKYEKAL